MDEAQRFQEKIVEKTEKNQYWKKKIKHLNYDIEKAVTSVDVNVDILQPRYSLLCNILRNYFTKNLIKSSI